ncbi:MAG: hypothetical protein B7733_22490 [Myxococcales bacterium FL481]|nr:MAG: hypothetical protein B7733_22490 [Myxococcales bacterium FL481]
MRLPANPDRPPRMRRADLWYLVALGAFAAVSFHPGWREPQLAGISLFGWLMATLMVVSPIAALTLFLRERKPRGGDSR